MHKESHTKSRAAIALALCFCVLVLTGVFMVKASLDKISDYGAAVTDSETPVSEDQKASAKTPVIDSQSENDQAESPGSNSTQSDPYIAPISGDILLKYSMDSLVYSKTLDQYMTHPGVDIRSDMSTEVKAIADGTVTDVYNDDRYGVTVQITHDGGLTSCYSNLSEHGLSEIGDEVTQGQVIGNIGDTALFESLDESHLHFAMLKDGNPTDPGDYIASLKVQ